MILRFLTTLYVLTRTKSATKYIILWKVIITSFKISNCFYLVIFHTHTHKNLSLLSMVTKTYIFFYVTPYIIFTHPVFLRLYWHIWHPWNISFPTIYNFMGVKCTHYKLCSVQSKLVYFSQFWGMKHFLGPVCDIWPTSFLNKLIDQNVYQILFRSILNLRTAWPTKMLCHFEFLRKFATGCSLFFEKVLIIFMLNFGLTPGAVPLLSTGLFFKLSSIFRCLLSKIRSQFYS